MFFTVEDNIITSRLNIPFWRNRTHYTKPQRLFSHPLDRSEVTGRGLVIHGTTTQEPTIINIIHSLIANMSLDSQQYKWINKFFAFFFATPLSKTISPLATWKRPVLSEYIVQYSDSVEGQSYIEVHVQGDRRSPVADKIETSLNLHLLLISSPAGHQN